MKKNYPILGILNILLFLIYVHNNIINFGGLGTSKYELIIFLGIGLFLMWNVITKKNIVISTSFKYILIFFIYFLILISFQFDNISRLKEYTIGSSGGIFFSYLIGVILSVCIYSIFQAKKILLINIYVFLFFIACSLVINSIQTNALSNLNNILFIIEDLEGKYQRSGSFISILFIIFSFTTLKISYINHIYSKKTIVNILFIILYIINAISLIFFSQMLGSNSSLLLISFVFILTISFIFMIFNSKKIKNHFEIFGYSKTFNSKFIISPLIKRILFGSIIIVGFIYSTIIYLDFDLNTTRIMNYGDNSSLIPSSLSSRIQLLKNNFLIHLNYNPFYGNMRVDEITTGKGTYAHSLPLSLLTHLGVIGLLIFGKIFYKIKEERTGLLFEIDNHYFNNSILLFRKYFFYIIIIIATLSTFFTWMVLWFVIGFISFPIINKKNNLKKL